MSVACSVNGNFHKQELLASSLFSDVSDVPIQDYNIGVLVSVLNNTLYLKEIDNDLNWRSKL